MPCNLENLRRCSLMELDNLFVNLPLETGLQGSYRGEFLQRLDSRGQRKPLFYVSAGFSFVPFGIDFTTRKWFFLDRRLQAGRFQLNRGPSRWRNTEVLQMHYHQSELPGFIRSKLYDEVKPINDTLALGLGGVNRHRGGDHFYFALVKMPDSHN